MQELMGPPIRLYRDPHRKVKAATAAAVADAPAKDLQVQGKRGENYRNYGVDEKNEDSLLLGRGTQCKGRGAAPHRSSEPVSSQFLCLASRGTRWQILPTRKPGPRSRRR